MLQLAYGKGPKLHFLFGWNQPSCALSSNTMKVLQLRKKTKHVSLCVISLSKLKT